MTRWRKDPAMEERDVSDCIYDMTVVRLADTLQCLYDVSVPIATFPRMFTNKWFSFKNSFV